MTEVMERAKLSHAVVFRDAACYSAHPHMAVAADRTWLLVFTQAPRRPVVLHPPLDPDFRNMLLRSTDEGRTWQGPEPVPDADATGMECAGLTPLPDGRVILNQWQFDWIDPDGIDLSSAGPDVALPDWLARARAGSVDIGVLGTREDDADLFRLARCNGGCRISVAADGGAPFVPATSPPTAPYSGGYGMRGAVIAGNGDILLPLSDVPHYARIFILRSSDDGTTWGAPEHVCAKVDCEFEEPAPIRLPDG
ncbi:MAG: exo-alpha-sialidase, partial [Rhodobiaceae bacterium]|nr:exo-alpha-sialidase [Rhodobiaceae bacterium]